MKGLALLTGITGIVALVLAAACSGTAKSSATSCAPSGLCGGSGGQVCTTVDARGVCSGIVYETGEGDNFQCDSCQDCTSAQSAASAACGGGSSSGGSGSSSGGGPTCVNGNTCADGSLMKVCTATDTTGACSSITYTVDGKSFACAGCKDCSTAQSEAASACAEASGSSSGGSGSGSGNSSGGSGSGSGSSSGGSGSGSGSSSGGSGSSSGSSSGGADQTCAAEGTSCLSCCQTTFATGFQDIVADVQACICGTGPCATSCATEYCANGSFTSTTDACATCFDDALAVDGGTCLAGVDSACGGNADCTAYITCTDGCPAQ
jgi:hypothetical protein